MNNEVNYRISMTKAMSMVAIALLFDLLQLASKLFIFIGLTVVGAGGGAYLGSFIGLAETGAKVGAFVGEVATVIGVGTALSVGLGILLSWSFSVFFAIIGYATLLLWFSFRRVTPFGKKAATKMTVFSVAIFIDILPLLNALFGMTVWTCVTIYYARKHDRTAARGNVEKMERNAGYNETDEAGRTINTARMRGPSRQYRSAQQ